MWIRCNVNPARKETGDCIVRAIAIATNRSWLEVYDDLSAIGRREFEPFLINHVWGKYLYELGFEPFLISFSCPSCINVRTFCKKYPKGTYIIGTGDHAIAVIDGDYYDSWDFGNEIPSYFWRVK